MRPLQRSIEAALAAQKQAVPQQRPSNSETQGAFSKTQERPQKITTYSEVREKVRAEAEIIRAKVPPEYRAEPYEQKAETPEQTGKTATTFSKAASAENEPKFSRSKMSAHFNEKSGANKTGQSQPDAIPKEKPEAEI